MKKKYKIILAIMLTIVCIGTGCGNTANTEIADETTQTVTTMAETTQEITEEETEENTKQEENSDKSDETTGGNLSDNWTDMQFQFDGKNYAIPFSYQDMKAAGWSFDLAEYGYDGGYVLNPGDKVSSTIDLTNASYDPYEVYINVGFINNDDTAKDITECDIWSFSLDVATGFSLADSYPDMKIAKGIGIGSTREEVEAAFGKTEEVYEDTELNYVSLEYSLDVTYYLRINIVGDYGVTSIELQAY